MIFRWASYAIHLLPWRSQLFLGRALGWFCFDILRIRRKIALENLKNAFPEKSDQERRQIARKNFEHLGISFVEFCRLPFYKHEQFECFFEIEGLEHFKSAQAERGVLFLSMHMGNGDWASSGALSCGVPLAIISKKFKWKPLNDFWFGVRKVIGIEFIPEERSTYEILKAIKNKKAVTFVLDQFMGPPVGVATKFFGRPTGTAAGLALFAERAEVPVLPIYNIRKPNGVVRIVIGERIPFEYQKNREDNVPYMTQKYTDEIEKIVRQCPEQWMWIHRRWKAFRPEGRLKWILIPFLIGMLGACASKPLRVKNQDEVVKIKEYEELVKIKEIEVQPTPAPTIEKPGLVPAVLTDASKSAATPVPKPKKIKKKKGSLTTPAGRQPDIEDDEGFQGRRPLVDPFRVGEKVTYDVSYFGVSAGEMTMEVLPLVEVNGRKAFHYVATVKSSSVFAVFYAVDDWGEAFVDYNALTPFTFEIHARESKQILESRSYFDWTSLTGKFWQKKITGDNEVEEKKYEWPILPFSQNLFSAPFYLRNFTLKVGKTIQFRMADDSQNMIVKAHIERQETVSTDEGNMDCLVVRPEVRIEGIFKPVGEIFFWISNDDRKFIVKIEAKIKIGKIVVQLKKLERG